MTLELKSAWRYVRNQPGFTLLAIVSLAVSLGANSVMFSVVNGFLLRDAVSVDPARYVGVFTTTRDSARAYRPFSLAEFELLRGDRTVFSDVSAVFYSQVALGPDAEPRRGFAFLVSDNFFALAGTAPAAGRFFTSAEAAPDSGSCVVVASHRLWQAAGRAPNFVGSVLRINGRPCTVIGVAPEGFSGASPLLAPEVWLPLGFYAEVAPAFAGEHTGAALGAPGNRPLQLFARLAPALTRQSAAPLLPVLAARLAELEPEAMDVSRELILARPLGIAPQPARESAFGPVTALSLGLSLLVLVVACLNLSNLLLARSSSRTAEIATRLALGATRGRIIGQLVSEGLLLGLAGGLLGLACSTWIGSLLANVLADRVADLGFVVIAQFEPDARFLTVSLVATLLAGLAFSLGPALRASRLDLSSGLKTGASGHLAGAGRTLWAGRSLLLIVQAAVSFVLLFAAGLFLHSAWEAAAPPAGLKLAGQTVAEFDFSLRPETPDVVRRRTLAAAETVRRTPGIASAGITSLVPYANDVQIVRAERSDLPATDAQPVIGAFAAVSEGYLPTMGTLLRGRDFNTRETEDASAPAVCVIDEGMARRLFPQSDPLGQVIRVRGGPRNQVDAAFTIVGLVSAHSQDVADRSKPLPRVFVPFARVSHPLWSIVARAEASGLTEAAAGTRGVERALRSADPGLPLLRVQALRDFLSANFGRWQAELGAVLFGCFGITAALLAAVGIYGVTSYAIVRRTRELGVLVALGASPADIARLISGRGLSQLAAACALGSLGALALGATLAGIVPGLPVVDPLAYGLATGVLLFAALPALFFPTRRALCVNPTTALRAD